MLSIFDLLLAPKERSILETVRCTTTAPNALSVQFTDFFTIDIAVNEPGFGNTFTTFVPYAPTCSFADFAQNRAEEYYFSIFASFWKLRKGLHKGLSLAGW